ncbi:MAG: DnaJ domain-containing protein [Opitutaceae bacterium]|nr:DnaJ domain-containing protein [Cytophagales bacterium]
MRIRILNYYQLLGLTESDSCQELYEECRKLFNEHHPSTSPVKESERIFVLVNEAYAVLLKDEIRKKYDYLLSEYSSGDVIAIEDWRIASEIMNLASKNRKAAQELKSEGNTWSFLSSFDFWNFF